MLPKKTKYLYMYAHISQQSYGKTGFKNVQHACNISHYISSRQIFVREPIVYISYKYMDIRFIIVAMILIEINMKRYGYCIYKMPIEVNAK